MRPYALDRSFLWKPFEIRQASSCPACGGGTHRLCESYPVLVCTHLSLPGGGTHRRVEIVMHFISAGRCTCATCVLVVHCKSCLRRGGMVSLQLRCACVCSNVPSCINWPLARHVLKGVSLELPVVQELSSIVLCGCAHGL